MWFTLQATSTEVKNIWTADISQLLWKQTLRNRNNRHAEMACMGIGSKPSLDIKQSSDNINDRLVDISISKKGLWAPCFLYKWRKWLVYCKIEYPFRNRVYFWGTNNNKKQQMSILTPFLIFIEIIGVGATEIMSLLLCCLSGIWTLTELPLHPPLVYRKRRTKNLELKNIELRNKERKNEN